MMMRRDVFTEEHELFREQFRKFAAKEIEPKIAKWNRDGITDRETWQRMGQAGFLRTMRARGVRRRRRRLPLRRDHHRRARLHAGARHHDDGARVDLPAVPRRPSAPRRRSRKFLPPAVTGDLLFGIGMTEPGAGSDLANIQTRADPRRRPLRRERRQDLHLDRPARRRLHHRREDRPERQAGPQGCQPPAHRSRHARLRARPEAREARLPGAGHERALLRGLHACRPRTCSARKGRASR